MMVYVWARRNEDVRMSFLGLFTFRAPLLLGVLAKLVVTFITLRYVTLRYVTLRASRGALRCRYGAL